MAAKKKSATFEQSLEALEELVERLEAGDLPLEEALADFEQGVKLTRECQKKLASAEQKVKMLMEENGSIRELPFEADDSTGDL
ncbi:exodeoxyribonuclease VII small subunit [Microbulbifer sp. THAF38]|uniref:exodeoxyribonuclease VII small subunit n=1 Tax=Microbulbifer sp. THAF38 TaxID=2587856 RepID=UPI0012683DFB|nr:exodeoxyribonuclease VII small subunit [Microbulbifer sp. THAF38]QFT56384.1 Exodeoxyribonuclease 7 small subunit [Microbulbifer sp. THAF38]